MSALCPSGNATIEARQSFLNALVSGLTASIYTPTTLKIRCQDGRQGAIPLGSDDIRQIVQDDRFQSWADTDAPALAEIIRDARRSAH